MNFQLTQSTTSLALFAKEHNTSHTVTRVKERIWQELLPQLKKPEEVEQEWHGN